MTAPDYPARNRLAAAIRASTLPPDERHVLRAYADYVNAPHGLALVWLPRARLKDETGLSSRRAQRAVDGLVAAGWLVEVEPAAGTRAARYRIEPHPGDVIHREAASDLSDETTTAAASDPTSPASDPTSSPSDPTGETRTQNSRTPPLPPSGQSALTAALVTDGAGDISETELLAVAARDPDTRSPEGRLLAAPSYRRECVERIRAQRRAAADTRWQQASKCEVCGRPTPICDQANRALPPEYRCPHSRIRGSHSTVEYV